MNSEEPSISHAVDRRRKRRRRRPKEDFVSKEPIFQKKISTEQKYGASDILLIVSAFLLGVGMLCGQVLFGGYGMMIFSLPTHFFAALAAITGGVAVWVRGRYELRVGCLLLGGALAVYAYGRMGSGAHSNFVMQSVFLFASCIFTYLLMGAYGASPARLVFWAIFLLSAMMQCGVALIQVLQNATYSPLSFLSVRYDQWLGDAILFRAIGLHVNPNALAWTLNAAVLVSLALAWWGRMGVKRRILLYYIAFSCFVMTLFAVSRGGVLSLLTGFLILFGMGGYALVATAKRHGWRILLVGGGIFLFIFLIGWGVYDSSLVIQERVARLFEDEARIRASEVALRVFYDHPLTGTGPGGFFYASRQMQFSDWWDFAHDDWSQLLAEYGWVGMSLAVLFFCLHFGNGLGECRRFILGRLRGSADGKSLQFAFMLSALAFLGAGLVHSFFDFNTQITANALLFSAVLGTVALSGKSLSWGRFFARVMGGVLILGGGSILWNFSGVWLSEWHLLQADNAMGRGEYVQAVKEARGGLESTPSYARLWYLVGVGDWRTSENLADMDRVLALAERAVQSFATARVLEPSEYAFSLDAMPALHLLGREEEEQRGFYEVIEDAPFYGPAYLAYARYWEGQGDLKRAARYYGIALHLREGAKEARAKLKALKPALK